MSAKRSRTPVAIITAPRSTLAQARHKDIDVVLKNLKLCSRRLKTALDSFKDDMRILERLYYKCKNQHRMALFFKRVHEMRRYGRRLSDLDILEHIDLLRASFVGLDHTNDHKALKGSWSHVPEQPYVDFLTERMTVCSDLVCKMRERLENAHHHFTLAMQTGAFVQFIVLFIAISSRMSVLSSELEGALQLGKSTCDRLLAVLQPAGGHEFTISQHTGAQHASSEQGISNGPPYADYDVPSEDMGQTVSCREPQMVAAEDLGMKIEVAMEVRVTPLPTNGSEDVTELPKTSTARAAQKPRVKKTKKKLDEIDEIFGF